MIVDKVLAILITCYDSAYEGHFLGRLTVQKAIRAEYYWPTMFQDAHDYTK